MAENQFAGRGQFSNTWLSAAGKNLTFSVLLSPEFLNPASTFILNIAVSIAINEVLRKIIGSDCKIKWPNDIYAGNNKLGGILIENIIRGQKLKYAIIGIGINVNQRQFPDLMRSTSLSIIAGHSFNRNLLLKQFCKALDHRYRELKELTSTNHLRYYYQNLFGLKETRKFIVSGWEITGEIKGIDDTGNLLVLIDGELRAFASKEISYLF